MIGIFTPIYLLILNYSLSSVLFFYALTNGIHALFAFPAAKISSKFGFKHSIIFSTPLIIVFYILLLTLKIYHWPLFLLALFLGINKALFWIGYHTNFSKVSDEKYRGEEVGFAKIFTSIFNVIGPLVGGLIITFFGFKVLFIVVSLLLFISIIPLFFFKDIHEPFDFSIKKIFTGQRIKNFFSFIGIGIENGVNVVIWPIFIFSSIVDNFTVLGSIKTISLFFSLIFILIIGKFSDIKRRLVLRIGALFNAVIWGIKTLVRTSLQVFVIDSFYGITKATMEVPFDALSYDKAAKSNIVESIVFREIGIQTGRVILFLLMIFIGNLIIGFSLGALGSLLCLLF